MNYRDFELGLIDKALTDTSLIDQAKEDRDRASALTAGMAERNRSRYGAALTRVATAAGSAATASNTLGVYRR